MTLDDVADFLVNLAAVLPADAPGFTVTFEHPDATPEDKALLEETWKRIQASGTPQTSRLLAADLQMREDSVQRWLCRGAR